MIIIIGYRNIQLAAFYHRQRVDASRFHNVKRNFRKLAPEFGKQNRQQFNPDLYRHCHLDMILAVGQVLYFLIQLVKTVKQR